MAVPFFSMNWRTAVELQRKALRVIHKRAGVSKDSSSQTLESMCGYCATKSESEQMVMRSGSSARRVVNRLNVFVPSCLPSASRTSQRYSFAHRSLPSDSWRSLRQINRPRFLTACAALMRTRLAGEYTRTTELYRAIRDFNETA